MLQGSITKRFRSRSPLTGTISIWGIGIGFEGYESNRPPGNLKAAVVADVSDAADVPKTVRRRIGVVYCGVVPDVTKDLKGSKWKP